VDNDKSNKNSINVLKEAGIQFEKHKTDGIDQFLFAEYFMTSGFIFSQDCTWICFQGNQDFGYMYRILANRPICDSEDDFLEDLKFYFPNLYDIKYMKHEFEELRGGLQRLGDILCLARVGQQHQAGSDSWLTGLCYFKLIETYLQDKDIQANYNNVLYGLGISENDEQYLDIYTSKTDELERQSREYYYNSDGYNSHNSMYGHEMGYANDGMAYAYNGGQLLQPTPHNPHMAAYGSGMSPNIYQTGYGMSPNHMEYVQDDGQNMHYPHDGQNMGMHNMQYQHMGNWPNQTG
jgi:hypothetical protein